MIDSKSKDKKSSTSLNTKDLVDVLVAEYLEANGCVETLSKFRPEFKLESAPKVLDVTLEELFCKFLESSASNEEHTTAEDELKQNVETREKKKKGKKPLLVYAEETNVEGNVGTKEEEKKKSKSVSNSDVDEKKNHKLGHTEIVGAIEKPEGKKKKKKKTETTADELTKDKNKVPEVEASSEDDNTKKESRKKRKRKQSDKHKGKSLTREEDSFMYLDPSLVKDYPILHGLYTSVNRFVHEYKVKVVEVHFLKKKVSELEEEVSELEEEVAGLRESIKE